MYSRLLKLSVVAGGPLLAGTFFFSSPDPNEVREAAKKEMMKAAVSDAPPNWNGPRFSPSFDFPSVAPKEDYPWEKIDFKEKPEEYLQSVINYAFKGMESVDWNAKANPVRTWYHAPWMHLSKNGREPIRGLTNELASPSHYLADNQQCTIQNWAIGFFNPAAATVFGKIWKDPAYPDISHVRFPPGSVTFKLLFTEATPDLLPHLKDSLVWQGLIAAPASNPCDKPDPSKRLSWPKDLRLLQVDVAIRDPRVDAINGTGWVYGTFIYDGEQPNSSPLRRLIPVGLMWGNDPGVSKSSGQTPQECWISEKAKNIILTKSRPELGWAGRLNGPVDNYVSACMSCHSTAQYPAAPLIPKDGATEQQRLFWFRNIKPGEVFDKSVEGASGLDYSLQALAGLNNFEVWKRDTYPSHFPIRERVFYALGAQKVDLIERGGFCSEDYRK